MNGRKWTEEEVKLLHTNMTNREIAEKTGRTLTAVKDKRHSEHQKRIKPEESVQKECRILALAKKLGVKLWTRNEK